MGRRILPDELKAKRVNISLDAGVYNMMQEIKMHESISDICATAIKRRYAQLRKAGVLTKEAELAGQQHIDFSVFDNLPNTENRG